MLILFSRWDRVRTFQQLHHGQKTTRSQLITSSRATAEEAQTELSVDANLVLVLDQQAPANTDRELLQVERTRQVLELQQEEDLQCRIATTSTLRPPTAAGRTVLRATARITVRRTSNGLRLLPPLRTARPVTRRTAR